MLLIGLLAGIDSRAADAQASVAQRANDRAAVQRALADLRAIDLPAGSWRLAHRPSGPPSIAQRRHCPQRTGAVCRHQFWLVPIDPPRLFGWLKRHPPLPLQPVLEPEFHSSFFNEDEGERTRQEWWGRSSHGVLGTSVTLVAARLRGHRSLVRIGATAVPVKTRSAKERVPAAATKIRLVIEREGDDRALTIHAPHRVDQIARLVDRLPLVQSAPFVEERPIEEEEFQPEAPSPPTVVLRFESRRGLVLAEASQRQGVGEKMTFAVRGRKMPPLEGGRRILRVLTPERRRAVSCRRSCR